MSDLEKLFEAIGNRRLSIRRYSESSKWRASMVYGNEEFTNEGDTPAQAIRSSLHAVLARAQEREREAEEAARDARDAVARLRNDIEGK